MPCWVSLVPHLLTSVCLCCFACCIAASIYIYITSLSFFYCSCRYCVVVGGGSGVGSVLAHLHGAFRLPLLSFYFSFFSFLRERSCIALVVCLCECSPCIFACSFVVLAVHRPLVCPSWAVFPVFFSFLLLSWVAVLKVTTASLGFYLSLFSSVLPPPFLFFVFVGALRKHAVVVLCECVSVLILVLFGFFCSFCFPSLLFP